MTTSQGEAKRRPGMRDVARRAGVSHQTVSRVLNDDPHVREATRECVRQAIAELGYRRNTVARALVTSRSFTIGVIISGSDQWGPSRTLTGVESAARKAGYFVSVASIPDADPVAVQDVFEHFADQAVDGVVGIAPEAATAHALDPFVSQVPVVLVAAGTTALPGVHVTSVDQDSGARMVTRHLIEFGHRDIAHISGPSDWYDANLRVEGWRAELAAIGADRATLIHGDWTSASGYAAGRQLAAGNLPTAIFAGNDLMALGAIKALADVGLSVPGDVSVAGFDDIPGAAHFIPGLTTVRQDFPALGQQCIAILLDVLTGTELERPAIASVLVPRESTGPVPERLS